MAIYYHEVIISKRCNNVSLYYKVLLNDKNVGNCFTN